MNSFSPWFSLKNVDMALRDTYHSFPIKYCNLNIADTMMDVPT
jgi:hypothetical protein